MSRIVLTLLTLLAAPAAAQDLAAGGGRPSDGLLDRPDLQALVDLQVRRDGPGLAAALADPDPVVRARAAFALASVQDTAAVPALVDALADTEARVRADAAFALGQTADSTAGGELLSALEGEDDPAVRVRLLEALGKTGGSDALARLAESAPRPGEERSRALAIARFGLRGVHHDAATAWLARTLDADDPAAREAAAYAFGRWTVTEPWTGHASAVRDALDALYPFQRGLPEVTAPDGPAAAIHLLAALGRLEDPADTERIVRWLEDGVDWRARVAAARALAGRTSEERARNAVVNALGDRSTHVGVTAAATLSAADSLPEETVRQLAILATQSANWRVTGEALPAVAKAGAEAMVIMFLMGLDTRDRGNVFARAKALRALGHGDTRGGFLVLEDEAGWESPLVATAAVEGLARRWERGAVSAPASPERYYAAFRAALERGDPGAVSAAAEALADSAFVAMGSVEALLAAWRALEAPDDLEAMTAVLSALGAAGDPAARPALEAALEHAHPAVRRAAADALEALTGEPVAIPAGPDLPDRTVDWSDLARLGPRPWLVLETDHGRIAIELDAEQAPLTVQTIAGFARDGRYAGVPFHRVVPNFVIQGGDFARGDGWGGPGFEIQSEFTRLDYERGTLGMASAGKDTEGSQWFVTHSMQPHLDGRYTAFGRVMEGMDVVDRVLEGDRVVSAAVLPRPPAEP